MIIKAVGSGQYGSLGGTSSGSVVQKPAAGNSKLLEAKSASALGSVAKSHTESFISNAKQVAHGAKGISKISIRA